MRLILALAAVALGAVLATACTAPPPTSEQLEAYNRYAQLRATDAAASEIIAAAKATEAAAAQQLAQLTATAAPTADAIVATAPLTSTQPVSATLPITGVAEISGALPPLTPTVALTITPTLTVAAPTPQATIALEEAWPWVPSLVAAVSTGQPVTRTVPTPTPTPIPAGQVTVTSAQVNLRGGPGMAFDVVATARQGDSLDVTGSDAGQDWWRVCCTDGVAGWVSSTVVSFQGDVQAVPVVGPLLPDDLQASWAMRWECHGRGCQQETCIGQSQATALRVVSDRWLEVKREATWDDDCAEAEDWLTQVDRYTGRERQSASSAPLFNIWEGADPGPANRSVALPAATLTLWCTATRTQEQTQAGGWTAVFEGQACYDVESGVLALMQYVKRWLFTGAIGNQTFDRQYFGDYEVIQQVLLDTNAPLSGR